MIRRLGFLITLFFTQIGLASVTFDTVVEEFLANNDSASTRTLPVLLSYSGFHSNQILKDSSQNHYWVQQVMLQNTLNNQRRVFAQKNFDLIEPIKPLWIINASLVHLNALQINLLLGSKLVKAINFSQKKIKLVAKQPVNLSSLREGYTYGLNKINVPQLRTKYPDLLGQGIRIGVLDTGIEASHPDLQNRLMLFKNFSKAKNSLPEDGFGHGTHVAGTIVGGNASGQFIGVAPQAKLVFGRIFDNNGESTLEDILEAMQWMADPDGNPATDDFAQVVNSSWSDDEPFANKNPADEPLCRAIESWVKLGMVPVFSAGNAGPDFGTVQVPGACPQALTVGATDQNDRSPRFSSSGPAEWHNLSTIKPDLVAPGVDIYSSFGRVDYEKLSGTSMAAPHVTGAIAIILQINPALTSEEAIRSLTLTAKDLGDPQKDNTFGWGRVDLFKAAELLCRSSNCKFL